MTLIPLIATKETIDIKKGGIITYLTDQVVGQEGIILLENPTGDYGLVIIDQVHRGGDKPVSVVMRPVNTPVRKFNVGDVVAQLAVF